jgi:hypothetical protein
LTFIKKLIEDFPLNAKFLYEEPSLAVPGNRSLNFVGYLVREVRNSFVWQLDQNSDTHARGLFQGFQTVVAEIFYQICSVCTLRTSELKEITSTLTDFYYEERLYAKAVGVCFRLLDAGLQERNITPFLYFMGTHPNDSVRVLYGNNRWHFARGMTLLLWISTLRRTDCRLFWMKTDDGSEVTVRLEEEKLVVETGKGGKGGCT